MTDIEVRLFWVGVTTALAIATGYLFTDKLALCERVRIYRDAARRRLQYLLQTDCTLCDMAEVLGRAEARVIALEAALKESATPPHVLRRLNGDVDA